MQIEMDFFLSAFGLALRIVNPARITDRGGSFINWYILLN